LTLTIEVPDSLSINHDKIKIFRVFTQSMMNRLLVGELRYGSPKKKQRYLTRLKKEIEHYNSNGNAEQLINIANYCVLEWIAPEHPKHHFDNTIESVTR
jgi:hypothetical protein